jgi:hypothetical protein
MRNEAAWSILSPTPVCVRDEITDIDICFWNGVPLTKSYALLIFSSIWMNIKPSPAQIEHANDEYIRAVNTNAFGHGPKDTSKIYQSFGDYKSTFSYLIYLVKGNDEKFFDKLCESYTAKDALVWFGND